MSNSLPPDSRPYDLVLFGATSFVGRHIAEYLLDQAKGPFTWAMAGRSAAKLDNLRQELALKWPAAASVPLVVADSSNVPSLLEMAGQTRVVCTTVGPYAKYGEALVAACLEASTHYCDLTGEIQFIRRMVDRHHEAAEAKGVRLVHACGFDSIPSDLGTWFLQREAQRRHGHPCNRVALYVKSARGGLSGGTIASGLHLVDESRDVEVRRWMADPYALNPAAMRTGQDAPDSIVPRFEPELGAWVLPFFMGPINKRVVRRTHALLGKPYGEDFRYEEWMRTGRGLLGRTAAWGIAGATALFFSAARLSSLRRFMEKTFLPSPGDGPSRDQVETGHFLVELVGHFADEDVTPMRVQFRGHKDPGYGATAVMFAESALCLSLDAAKLKSPGGVLTPAYAMGEVLLDRLQKTDCIQVTLV